MFVSRMFPVLLLALFLSFPVLFTHCGKASSSDIQETAQQVGDVMASIDETGGAGGSLGRAMREEGDEALLKRREPPGFLNLLDRVLSPAYATTCALAATFGTCSNNVITRTFGGCTIGGATLAGTVTLTWAGSSSSCSMAAANDTVTRVPNFTLTGRRGSTLTVTKTGTVGQALTWTSGSGSTRVFSFSNDGIRRLFTAPGGGVVMDFSTQTLAPLTVTGTARSSRILSGGSLRVTNNMTTISCDYSASNVTWTSTCTCAASGSWSGTCTDGKESTITLTGCGTATLAIGSVNETLTFDRCYGV